MPEQKKIFIASRDGERIKKRKIPGNYLFV
jgi:hypothetical protein